MAKLIIHRGTHQIGGGCTELSVDGQRILIDLGANLPDSDVLIQDDELIAKVFDGRPAAGLLFTHPHGDHYGLYKKVLLFVSPISSDWSSERKYIESSGLVYAYVESEMEDGISEIMAEPRDGGLIRLG